MRFSKFSFLFCVLLLIFAGSFFYPKWQKPTNEAQISWDAGGYYWYLPSAFIYKDLKAQGFKDSIMQKYQPTPADDFQYGYKHSSGNYVIRYTIGTALLELPFFWVAHVAAKPLGFPNDGFSLPYQFMIYFGGISFAVLGLWYLRKLLLLYYSHEVVAIVLLLLVLGTNYLNYCGIEVGMTHCWLFTLYVFIMWNTHNYYKTLKRKYAIRIGVLLGIIALVRPPEIIAVIIPLLWGLNNIKWQSIRERLQFFKSQISNLMLAAIICVCILSLQFVYWKYATGSWFVYTYRDQGFSWLSPNFKQYAFNWHCGWLLYTPMMILALVGIGFFAKTGKNRVAILVLIILNYYIVAAWDAWDYGGRAMIQNYVLLLFPLASLVAFLLKKKVRLVVAMPFIVLFAYFNLWWTYQAHHGGLFGGTPTTKTYFLTTLFRYNLPYEIQKLRDNEDLYLGKVENETLLYNKNLKDSTATDGIIIINEEGHLETIKVIRPNYKWIRASTTIHIDDKEWFVWRMTQVIMRFKKGDNTVKENVLRFQRFIENNETKTISIDAELGNQDFDAIELQYRNDGNGPLPAYIQHIKVIGFNE